jgi:putative membrane protein
MGANFSALAPNIVAAILFAVLGVSTFVAAFWIVDRLTPYDLWKEVIEEQNVAVAILMGLIGVGLAIVIAAAIH